VQIRLLRLADVTGTDAQAWQRLADDALAPNMCLDPRFLVPARHRGVEMDEIRVLVVQEGGEWLAALALTTKRVASRVPVRALTTGGAFMTRECDRHHPLVRRDRPAEALDALLRGATTAGLPGLALLRRFPAEGPLADALTQVADRRRMLVHEKARDVGAWAPRDAVTVPAVPPLVDGLLVDPPLPTAHLRKDDARNIRRVCRGLVRELGGPLELHDESGDPTAVDRFVALQASGWKGDAAHGGAALGLDPVEERWFRESVAAFRHDGDLAVLRLAAGGTTLWTGYQVRSGGAWFGMLDAYDERFRRFSPGSVGRLAMLGYLLGTTDAPFVDPGFSSHYAVGARIWPAARAQVDLLVSTRGLAAHAVLRAAPLARRFGLVA
jgi:CelD/BcsL family acetyltransferase involved in cellulose biosynthesis